MADSTKLPTLAELFIGQWARKDEPAPSLDNPLTISDTTLTFSVALKDEDGDVPTAAIPIGIRKENGWVEQCVIPANGLSADGKTATGVIRGVDPAGTDWTTGSSDFADVHEQGESVFINIPAFWGEMIRSALQGLIATGGTSFLIGTNAEGTVTIKRSTGTGTSVGFLRWSATNGKVEYSNNGTDWLAFDDTVASVLAKVSSNDTSPGYFATKLQASTGVEFTILNPAADEKLEIKAHGNLADVIDDVSSSSADLDDAVANYNALATAILPTGFYEGGGVVVRGVLGEEITAADISTNKNLVYQSPVDMKWYKITSTSSTWYHRLGLILEAGLIDTTKRVLLEGKYSNQTFASVNPTFTSALTGVGITVADVEAHACCAFLVDNSTGAECVLTGTGTISAKRQGSPAGAMLIFLVLVQQGEQPNKPAAFWDTVNTELRGAILGRAEIPAVNFSGLYQDLAFNFGSSIKIPAGYKAYIVVGMDAAPSGSDYYLVQSSAATAVFNGTTKTWSGTANAGNLSLAVTSTSSIGYGVKAYAGSNGSYGLVPTAKWSKVIGRVLSATEMYFNPNSVDNDVKQTRLISNTGATNIGLMEVVTNFCPSSVKVTEGLLIDATTDQLKLNLGVVRGDKPSCASDLISSTAPMNNYHLPYNFLAATGGATEVEMPMGMGINAPIGGSQNYLYLARLEKGFYLFNGYPATAAFYVGGNVNGFTNAVGVFDFDIRG